MCDHHDHSQRGLSQVSATIADSQVVYAAIIGKYFQRFSSETFILVFYMSSRGKVCARHLAIDPASINTVGNSMLGSSEHPCLPGSRTVDAFTGKASYASGRRWNRPALCGRNFRCARALSGVFSRIRVSGTAPKQSTRGFGIAGLFLSPKLGVERIAAELHAASVNLRLPLSSELAIVAISDQTVDAGHFMFLFRSVLSNA